jgi:hypothetical protein
MMRKTRTGETTNLIKGNNVAVLKTGKSQEEEQRKGDLTVEITNNMH